MKFIENSSARMIDELTTNLGESSDVSIAVAFIRDSGVSMILESVRSAILRGVRIRVLFGLDFAISEASAVSDLIDAGVSVRAYTSDESFHPKGYVFITQGYVRAIVGSSNLSASGLVSGREWNVSIQPADRVLEEFDRLWESDSASPVTDALLDELEQHHPSIVLDRVSAKQDFVEAPSSAVGVPLHQAAEVGSQHFYFAINKSFKRGGQITIPSSQVSYEQLEATGWGLEGVVVVFEDQHDLSGRMYSGVAGYGPYYQIYVKPTLDHRLFALPIDTRVMVSLVRDNIGSSIARIARS